MNREEKITNLVSNLLSTAQELVELQGQPEIGEINTNQLGSIVYEENDERCYRYDDGINLIKSLITAHQDYKQYMDQIKDKYDPS